MSRAQRQGSDHSFSSLHTGFAPSPTALRSGAQAFRSGSAVTATPHKHTPSPLHTSARTLSPQRTDSSLSQRTASPSSSATTSPLDTISEIAHAAFPAPPTRTSPIPPNASHASRKKRYIEVGQNETKMTEQTKDINKVRKDSDAPDPSHSMSPSIMSPIGSLQSNTKGHRAMPRTSSIDSAISSLSSASQSHKSSFDANAVSQADIDNLVAAAGSPEAVIIHLLKEKHHAASQNAQLWKLVDKQRTLIMGLNKDLERALMDKERYKKKAKDLQTATPPVPSTEAHTVHPLAIGAKGVLNGKPSTGDLPTSQSRSSGTAGQSPRAEVVDSQDSPITTPSLKQMIETELLTEEPDLRFESQSSQQSASIQEASATSPTSPASLASPSSLTRESGFGANKGQRSPNPARKPPPAPLNLGQTDRTVTHLREASDSDSEYEDILAVDESPVERGRRKTRADDDREREAALSREPQDPGTAQSRTVVPVSSQPLDARREAPPDSLAAALSHRMMPPSLADRHMMNGPKSPGLPLSPRPEDRPLGSPMPRLPREMTSPFSSLNMTSGNNPPGLPLSPRLGKQQAPFTPGTTNAPTFNRPIPSIDAAVRIDSPQTPSPKLTGIYQELRSDDYPNLLLPPNALPLIQVKVSSSRLRPSRNSYMVSKPLDEEPVFTLSVFSRSESSELWRVEKIIGALPQLDHQIRQLCAFPGRLPDRSIFGGHSPAKVDARRVALNMYFDTLLDTPMDEKAALVICQFLTSDAIEPRDDETSLLKGVHQAGSELLRGPDGKPRKEGYLTKRGKNFGGWKARYFVLHGPELRYFEAPGGAHMGTIKIPNAQIGKQSQPTVSQGGSSQADDDSDNQYRHAFLILEPKKKDSSALVRHVLCAESDEERDTWVEALLEYVEENDSSSQAPSNATSRNKLFPNGSRKGSKGTDSPDLDTPDAVQGFSYENAVPAEPPVLGLPSDPKTPRSPMFSSSPFQDPDSLADHGQISSKMISAPTNGAIIQDAGAWGNKPTTSTKEKKRSIWGFRTRSSIDLASQLQSVSEGPTIQIHGAGGEKRDLIKPVFGIPLVEAVKDCAPFDVDVDLPAVVYRCLEYLRAKGAESEEGIFRLSGSNVVVKALRERFNTEGDVDFLAGDHYYDVHAVASLFKQYLRELPSTVLTRELHIEFLRVLDLNEKHKKIAAFNSLIYRLPKPNLALLRALVQFLIVIVNNSDVNKMTVRNVGIVFAPTLNIPAPVFSMFLTDFEEIFDDVPEFYYDEKAVELTVDNSLSPEDIRSPRHQMFSDIPTPAPNQMTFPRPGDRPEEYIMQQDTGFIPMQPSYDAYGQGRPENYNQAPAAVSRMLAPESDNARSTKAKRRESNILFMDFNDDAPPPTYGQ